MLILSLCATPGANAAGLDPGTVSLYGIRLGMTPAQVRPLLVAQYGKIAFSTQVVCFKDYMRALHGHKSAAPQHCISELKGEQPQRTLEVHFIEDLAHHRPGRMVAVLISYNQALHSEADRAAFRQHALAKYGQPAWPQSNVLAYYQMQWCSNLMEQSPYCPASGWYGGGIDIDGSVNPNQTPYGYVTDPLQEPPVNRILSITTQVGGAITLYDNETPFKTILAFSKAVNPQTTQINF